MVELVKTRVTPAFRMVIWLIPACYALHIAEEYKGGFAGWVTDVVGGSMSDLAFALNNAAFMAILLGLIAWTIVTRSERACFFLILGTSGLLFWDFLFHLGLTVALDRYSPGLVTAALLYYPLSIAVAWVTLRDGVLGAPAFAAAVAGGAGLLGFVMWYGLFHFAT